jgi:hypothetical protein
MPFMVPRLDRTPPNNEPDQGKILSNEIIESRRLPGVRFTWRAITVIAKKAGLFSDGRFFRESPNDLSCLPEEEQLQFLGSHTSLLFKPDAVVAKKIWPTIKNASSFGFMPIWFTSIELRGAV